MDEWWAIGAPRPSLATLHEAQHGRAKSPSLIDACEHAAAVELLRLSKGDLLLQVANPLLAVLELASLVGCKARVGLGNEDFDLLVERVQKLDPGRENSL